MNLRTSFEIAQECGLETVGEAILNIDIHAMNIFNYDEINKELTELYREYNCYFLAEKMIKDTKITDALLYIESIK